MSRWRKGGGEDTETFADKGQRRAEGETDKLGDKAHRDNTNPI